MDKNFRVLNNGRNYSFIFLVFALVTFFSSANLFCQAKTNLEIFYSLIDSAVINAARSIPADRRNIKLSLGAGSIYTIFNNRIMESFQNAGKNVITREKDDSLLIEANFAIEKTTVNYGDLFQQKLFGDFYVPREITISGNYLLFAPGLTPHNFNYTSRDTVNINEIKNIENNALPFTQGKLPSEPLFSSIYEPVIAIGAAAVTVILFFTIRSK